MGISILRNPSVRQDIAGFDEWSTCRLVPSQLHRCLGPDEDEVTLLEPESVQPGQMRVLRSVSTACPWTSAIDIHSLLLALLFFLSSS